MATQQRKVRREQELKLAGMKAKQIEESALAAQKKAELRVMDLEASTNKLKQELQRLQGTKEKLKHCSNRNLWLEEKLDSMKRTNVALLQDNNNCGENYNRLMEKYVKRNKEIAQLKTEDKDAAKLRRRLREAKEENKKLKHSISQKKAEEASAW